MLSCHSCYIYGTRRSKEVGEFKVVIRREAEEGGGGGTKSKEGANFYGGVDPSVILSELPTYFSLFLCKKSSMICTTKHSFLLKPHKH